MELIRFVVVEDQRRGYNLFDQLFGPDGISPDIPNLQLDREISLPFPQTPQGNRETISKIRDGIAERQGPMILALDLDLGLDEESKKTRSEVRALTEQHLGKPIPGEIDRQIDGLLIGVEAIRQKNIKPLLLVIQTGHGKQDDLEILLKTFAKSQNREHEVKIIFGKYLSSGNATSKSVTELFNDIQEQFQAAFGGKLAKFFQLLDGGADGDTTHNNLDNDPKAETTRLLTALLDLSEEEFTSQLWETWKENLTKPVTETVKTMGIKERDRLSASAGWFFALAAYRHSKDPRDWRKIFEIRDLRGSDLEKSYLTPPQSEATLRRTIICFYEMCRALFKSEEYKDGDPQSGPLIAVNLSKDDGLRMLLNFDCAPAPDESKPRSLYEQVGRWRNNSIEWQPMNTSFDARTTSRAIWRFWLATSVGDKPIPDPEAGGSVGVFGSNRLWRMNIFRRPEGRSEVVFNVK